MECPTIGPERLIARVAKLAAAAEVARMALGPSAVPEYVVSYPLCIRLSMTAGTEPPDVPPPGRR